MKARGKIKKEDIIKAFERKQAEVLLRLLDIMNEVVKAKEFNELKEIVRELAEAQRQTTQSIKELTEAQKKSEDRISKIEITMQELIEAQKRSEERISKVEARLEKLEITVQELIEAQKRSEERISRAEERLEKLEITVQELIEAQKKSEERLTKLEITMQELIEAQKNTEDEIRRLTKSLISLKEEVGGLSHTVGYRLEDEAIKSLPSLLKRDMDIEVIGRLRRDFLEVAPHKYIELNIWGEGERNGKKYVIIGEAKSQLKKRDVDDFMDKVEEIKRYVSEEQICLLVTYITSPDVRRYAEEKGIKIYFSYEL